MDAPAWSRIKEVFQAALDVPASERAAFLDRACGDDLDVRREVMSLLAETDDADCPIERQAEQIGEWFGGRAAAAGARIGAYEIVRELGRGGMGTVLLARRADGQYRHEVALKMIRRTVSTPDLAQRFRRERQILASLNHANIAGLLDGGVTADGEPYLVMEYVEGEPLLAYVARHRLGVTARLTLFLQVCRAVAYAHGKLVVHRDIKPSNVLVTAAGEPKLVDFGLAKILDDTLAGDQAQTVASLRAFTPSYASPEQILGHDATTATDVYSLGIVLYELLVGAPPFDLGRRSMTDILRVIETVEPARPSEAARRHDGRDAASGVAACAPADLAGDLDNIVLMAIRRAPEQRYDSVQALAADLGRYLDGLPVLARPQTFAYRAAKFVRRHAVAVAASALVAVALVAALVVALWQAGVARDQRDRAARRFNDVRQLSHALLFDVGPKIERLQGATEAREVLLRRAVEYLDSLATESSDDLSLVAELAAAYEKVGDLQGNPTNPNLVELDAAIASYQKARALRQRVLAVPSSSLEARRAAAENQRVLGTIFAQANDFERAGNELGGALRSFEALAAEHPDDRALRWAVARTRHDVGRNFTNTKRYASALEYFAGAIAAASRLLAERPEDLETVALLADSHAQHGLALSWEGRQREAEAEMARAAALYEPAALAQPNDVALNTGLWSTYWLTSSVYEEQDDARSHAFALKALDVARHALARDPANTRARQQLAKSLSRAGQTATNTRHQEDALRYLTESTSLLRGITSREARNGRLNSELALALTRLAETRMQHGQLAPALAEAQEAADIYRAVTDAAPGDKRSVRNLVVTHELIGDIQVRRAAGREALDSYGVAVALLEKLQAENALAAVDEAYLERIRAKASAVGGTATPRGPVARPSSAP